MSVAFAELTPEEMCAEIARLRGELADAKWQNRKLTHANRDQARTNAALVDDCPPWAPSLAIVYWKFADFRSGLPGWNAIQQRLKPLIADLGDLPAPMLTPLKWDEHRARRRLTVTNRGRPPCEATLNLELTYAKALLNFGEEREMIKRNALQVAKPVKTTSERETKPTPDHIERLLAAADDVVNRRLKDGDDDGAKAKLLKAFILCKFDGLMRFTEARKLRLSQIGEDGELELLASETKGRHSRIVRLTQRTLEAIRAIERKPGAVYVFEGPYDHPGKKRYGLISDSAMRAWFYRACEVAGLDSIATDRDHHLTPHDLRAGGATAADKGGARARAIQRVLGHRSLVTTQWYLRSDKKDDADDVHGAVVDQTGQGRLGPRRAESRRKDRK